MPVFVRDAELTDMDDLQGVFHRASLFNENDRDLLHNHPERLALSDEGVLEGRMRVATGDDGAVVAFATYLISGGVAEIEDLFVDPPWIGNGIGSALVQDISARLDERGFDSVEVTANPDAVGFYEHLGFVTDRTVATLGNPARRMSRSTRSPDATPNG